MKIHDIEQNSDEWHNIRKGKITASIFKDLISPVKLEPVSSIAGKKAFANIIANSVCQQNSDEYQSYDMIRGIECEPRARRLYEEINLVKVKEVGFISHESGLAGFSPDGKVEDNGMIEIKTQCQKEHFYCKIFGFDEWLKKYKPQLLLSMVIDEDIKWCDCISYNEDFVDINDRIIIHRYHRNDEEVTKARDALTFWIDKLKGKKQ